MEKVYKGGTIVFLNSDEKELPKIIYQIESDVTSGDVFKIISEEVKMSYTQFYEIIKKLERLRLIDVVMSSKKTRYIIKKKYNRDVVVEALKEF